MRRCSRAKRLGPGHLDSGVSSLSIYCGTLAVLVTSRCWFGHSDCGSPLLFHGLGKHVEGRSTGTTKSSVHVFFLAESGTCAAFPNGVDQTTCAAGFSGDQLVSSHSACSATRARLSSTLKRHAHRDHIITDSLSSLDGVQKSER